MTKYVLNKEPIEAYDIKTEEFVDEGNDIFESRMVNEDKMTWKKGSNLIYDCYGVVNHYGSSHFGHYTAFVKREDGWYCADDSNFG